MYIIAYIFFVGALALFILWLMLDEFPYFLICVFFMAFGFMNIGVNQAKDRNERELKAKQAQLASFVETSSLNVIGITDTIAYIECFHPITNDRIKLEISILTFQNNDQLAIQKSKKEIVILNKDNIKDFYPNIDCLART